MSYRPAISSYSQCYAIFLKIHSADILDSHAGCVGRGSTKRLAESVNIGRVVVAVQYWNGSRHIEVTHWAGIWSYIFLQPFFSWSSWCRRGRFFLQLAKLKCFRNVTLSPKLKNIFQWNRSINVSKRWGELRSTWQHKMQFLDESNTIGPTIEQSGRYDTEIYISYWFSRTSKPSVQLRFPLQTSVAPWLNRIG